jgi:hypothetical protein
MSFGSNYINTERCEPSNDIKYISLLRPDVNLVMLRLILIVIMKVFNEEYCLKWEEILKKMEEKQDLEYQEMKKQDEDILSKREDKMSRKRWGVWEWKSAFILDLNGPAESYPPGYEIYLPELTSSAAILDFIAQISEKTWASREDVGNLVEAFDDLLTLRRNYCSGGQETFRGNEVSIKAMLEQKYSM